MNNVLIYFFVALGLSMDAFSLAIVYGVNKIDKIKTIILSLLVGIFHFFMPLLGSLLGTLVSEGLTFASNIIVGIVFFVIAIEMIISLKDTEKVMTLNKLRYLLLFALTVSIDSLSVGIAYGILKENLLISFFIFSITSAIFTFLGLIVGKFFGKKFSDLSKIIGIVILLLLSLKYLIKLI